MTPIKISISNLDISLVDAEIMKSREAVGMYKKDGRIYKLLNYSSKVENEQKKLVELVPSPIKRVAQGIFYYKDKEIQRTKDVLVIEMTVIEGEFFQISHGGSARLVNWINEEFDKDKIRRILRGLTAAKKAMLQDPQGFYVKAGSSPLMFIDLHAGDSEPITLDNAIAAAESQLLKEE